jgi:hypothetical protein
METYCTGMYHMGKKRTGMKHTGTYRRGRLVPVLAKEGIMRGIIPCPVVAVLFYLFMSWLSCPGSPVLATHYWLPCSCRPFLVVHLNAA